MAWNYRWWFFALFLLTAAFVLNRFRCTLKQCSVVLLLWYIDAPSVPYFIVIFRMFILTVLKCTDDHVILISSAPLHSLILLQIVSPSRSCWTCLISIPCSRLEAAYFTYCAIHFTITPLIFHVEYARIKLVNGLSKHHANQMTK